MLQVGVAISTGFIPFRSTNPPKGARLFFVGQSEGVVATPKAWTAGCAATEGCELRDNLFGEVMRKMPHPACGKSKQDLSHLAGSGGFVLRIGIRPEQGRVADPAADREDEGGTLGMIAGYRTALTATTSHAPHAAACRHRHRGCWPATRTRLWVCPIHPSPCGHRWWCTQRGPNGRRWRGRTPVDRSPWCAR